MFRAFVVPFSLAALGLGLVNPAKAQYFQQGNQQAVGVAPNLLGTPTTYTNGNTTGTAYGANQFGYNGGLGASSTLPITGPAGAVQQYGLQRLQGGGVGNTQTTGTGESLERVREREAIERAAAASTAASSKLNGINLVGFTVSGHGVALSSSRVTVAGRTIIVAGAPEVPETCRDHKGLAWSCGELATHRLQDMLDQGQVHCQITQQSPAIVGHCLLGHDDIAQGLRMALADAR